MNPQKQAILDADNAKGDVIDLLAPLVCDKSRFTVENKSVQLNVRNPITVEGYVSTDFDDLRIDFGMKVYDPSRNAGERFLNPGRWLRRGGNAFHFGIGYPF